MIVLSRSKRKMRERAVAETSRRRQGEILQATFTALDNDPEGLPAKEVIERVERILSLTDFERSNYPGSSVRRFDKIIRFNTIAPVKAGWLVKTKGRWVLTDEARIAKDKFHDPAELMRESVRLYQAWRKGRAVDDEHPLEEGVPDLDVEVPQAAITLEEAEDTARSEIRNYLASMPPYQFQELVASLLRAMDYHVAWVAPPGPDRGIDIVAYTDPLGATGPRIKVQVKRRADKIPVQEVRSFMAVLSNNDVGLFVTTGGFTSEAQTEARHQENRRISLLGLDELFDLWVEHYEQIPEAERQLLPLRPVYFLSPSE